MKNVDCQVTRCEDIWQEILEDIYMHHGFSNKAQHLELVSDSYLEKLQLVITAELQSRVLSRPKHDS